MNTTQTIYLNGKSYADGKAVHRALQQLLDLPEYYGMNADALYDCLSERKQPVSLYIAGMGEGDVAETLKKVRCVMEDLGGTVTVREE